MPAAASIATFLAKQNWNDVIPLQIRPIVLIGQDAIPELLDQELFWTALAPRP